MDLSRQDQLQIKTQTRILGKLNFYSSLFTFLFAHSIYKFQTRLTARTQLVKWRHEIF
jgi:hypothetical protein